jgi:hypothetical protein
MPKIKKIMKVPVRTSERTAFMRCHWLWYMSYVKGWKAKRPGKALVFGDLIHQALGGTDGGAPGYYIKESAKRRRRGPDPTDTFRRLVIESKVDFKIRDEDEEQVDMLELGSEMLSNYVARWGKDWQWLILHPEMPFQVEVYTEDGRYVCTYVGKTDALIQDLNTGALGLFEHKTAKSIPKGNLWNNEQGTSYWTFVPSFLWEIGVLDRDQDLQFMLFNYLRKGMADTRPQNEKGQYLNKPTKEVLVEAAAFHGISLPKGIKVDEIVNILTRRKVNVPLLGEPSKNQPTPLFERKLVMRGIPERENLLARVIAQADEMAFIRDGEMPLYKMPGDHCDWCPFGTVSGVCEAHEIGTDWEELLNMEFVKWDPYKDHREVVY